MELSDADEYENMPLSNRDFQPRWHLAWYWWVAIALVCLSLLVFV